jgi:hypothetical protein
MKQWDQRLGQMIGEWTQTRSKSGTENEGVLHGHALARATRIFKHSLDKPAILGDGKPTSG